MPASLARVAGELAEGLALYRSRDYWNAHERWERAWRQLEPPAATWVQGLILVAAAAHHGCLGHPGPARRLLLRALPRLRTAPGTVGPVRLPDRAAERIAAMLELGEVSDPPLVLERAAD